MFRGNTSKLAFEPKEGMEVLATGTVSVYEAGGNYQLYVSDMIEEGVGNLYVAFEKLKEKLSKEPETCWNCNCFYWCCDPRRFNNNKEKISYL